MGLKLTRETKTAWVVSSTSIEKPWGEETKWASTGIVTVKTLTLKKGQRNSFKFNTVKNELLICASGKLRAYYGDEEIVSFGFGDLKTAVLDEKMALSVQSGCPYRLEALEDSIILEVSSNDRGDSGVNRIHDDYGRKTIELTEHMQRILKKWFPT